MPSFDFSLSSKLIPKTKTGTRLSKQSKPPVHLLPREYARGLEKQQSPLCRGNVGLPQEAPDPDHQDELLNGEIFYSLDETWIMIES